MSKPKLLLVGHTYCLDVNREKAEAFRDLYDVTVATIEMDGLQAMGRNLAEFEDESRGSYELVRFRAVPSPQKAYRSWWKGFGGWLIQRTFDVVLVEAEPWSLSLWQTWFFTKFRGRCRVFAEFTWENLERTGLKGLFLDGVYRLAMMKGGKVICGNTAAREIWRRKGMVDERLLVAPQLGVGDDCFPISHEKRRELRRGLGIAEDAFCVGYVGRLVEEKGLEDLVAGVSALREKGVKAELVLLGGGELREWVVNLKHSWITLLEPCRHREVASRIQCFDVLALPSRSKLTGEIWEEQFGHVLIEAMACGVVTVGSDSGAIPEVIGDEELIFGQRDVGGLAACLLRLQSDSAYYVSKREWLLARVKEDFTHEAVARNYHAFFEEDRDGK